MKVPLLLFARLVGSGGLCEAWQEMEARDRRQLFEGQRLWRAADASLQASSTGAANAPIGGRLSNLVVARLLCGLRSTSFLCPHSSCTHSSYPAPRSFPVLRKKDAFARAADRNANREYDLDYDYDDDYDDDYDQGYDRQGRRGRGRVSFADRNMQSVSRRSDRGDAYADRSFDPYSDRSYDPGDGRSFDPSDRSYDTRRGRSWDPSDDRSLNLRGDRSFDSSSDRSFDRRRERDDRSFDPSDDRSFDPRGDRSFESLDERRRDRSFDPSGDRSFDSRRGGSFDAREDRGRDRSYDPRDERSFDPRGDRSFDPRGDRGYDPRDSGSFDRRGDISFDPYGYDDRSFGERIASRGGPDSSGARSFGRQVSFDPYDNDRSYERSGRQSTFGDRIASRGGIDSSGDRSFGRQVSFDPYDDDRSYERSGRQSTFGDRIASRGGVEVAGGSRSFDAYGDRSFDSRQGQGQYRGSNAPSPGRNSAAERVGFHQKQGSRENQEELEELQYVLADFCQSDFFRKLCDYCNAQPTEYGTIQIAFDKVDLQGSTLLVKLQPAFEQRSEKLLDKLKKHLRSRMPMIKRMQYESRSPPSTRTYII